MSTGHTQVVRRRLTSASGVVPVAVLGSATFDATQVDPGTVRLAGASVKVMGNGEYDCKNQDVNADGFPDLVCKVMKEDIVIAVGDSIAILVGQTFTGERFIGEESIQVKP
jgi:hypothetical protein